ncbi:MAG: HIT domain-containing protein, partial [Candidatus Pacearchaeota archaeon]
MAVCVFCKIAKGEIPKEFTYEDKEIVVFPDINPIASTHLLVVPREHITDFLELKSDRLFGKLMKTIQEMVKKSELEIQNGLDHLL